MLEDPERRPRTPIIEIPREVMEHWPVEDFALDPNKFARNLRSARKGAAPGPSGMTSEHLRPLLSHPNDVLMLHRMGEQLARGQVPQVVIEAIRVGRMIALQKPDSGVRGTVAGDILRRLVGSTIAQQINPIVERCTAPFQYALTTRAGTECVAHALPHRGRARGDSDVIDGISAFDLITVRPDVTGGPSVHLWEDDSGVVHHIRQGEGGDQWDPLMPLLYSLGQHSALVSIQEMLRDSERLFAFHDDLYVVTVPNRVGATLPLSRNA